MQFNPKVSHDPVTTRQLYNFSFATSVQLSHACRQTHIIAIAMLYLYHLFICSHNAMLLTWLHGDYLRVDGVIHHAAITVDGMAGEADCVFGMVICGNNSNRWQVSSHPSS